MSIQKSDFQCFVDFIIISLKDKVSHSALILGKNLPNLHTNGNTLQNDPDANHVQLYGVC